jgi:hypothetical protein
LRSYTPVKCWILLSAFFEANQESWSQYLIDVQALSSDFRKVFKQVCDEVKILKIVNDQKILELIRNDYNIKIYNVIEVK